LEISWHRGDKSLVFGSFSHHLNQNEVIKEIKLEQVRRLKKTSIKQFYDHQLFLIQKALSFCKCIKKKQRLYVMNNFMISNTDTEVEDQLDNLKDKMYVTQVIVRKYNVDWLRGQVEELYELLSKCDMLSLFDD
jgi:hypothetical protein